MAEYSLSVALATYNGEEFLKCQLDSILNQTLKPSEIIVSDDHSTDNTIEILDQYQRVGLLKYFSNPEKGVVSNFKNAVSKCSVGNYVALADQDDIWLPEKLEIQRSRLSLIESGEMPALVFSDLIVVGRKNTVIHKSFFKDIVNANPAFEKLGSLLFSNKVIGCTVMFNNAMKIYMDSMPVEVCMHDYWLALISFTFGKHSYIAEPLIRYRRHYNNVTNTENSILFKIKKEFSDYLYNKEIQLDSHIQTVDFFYSLYKHLLTKEQVITIESFLELKNKSTFFKRLNSFYNTRN